jgi:alcohol dehydrogenase
MHIPDYFEFYNKTKISAGKSALENIPFELESMNAVKPLVITDKKSVKNGVVKAFVKSFYNSGVTIGAIYDEMPGYASSALLKDLSKLFRDRGCDSIIAIGGDAAASAAKGLNILVSNKSENLLMFEDMTASAPLKPFIFIPTSEARGTETSSEAVIDSHTYRSDDLHPDLVVIDKRMLKWNEKKVTASSAMLALTQAIEACTFSESNPLNDSFAYAAIELVYENLAGALKCHCNKKEKAAFINGVAISGIVYSNAPEGLARAIGFEMEKMTGLHAGLCAGLVLPYALDYKFRFDKAGVRGELLLPLAGIENYCAVHESERAEKSIELLYLLIDNLEGAIPGRIKDLNIPVYMLKRIAEAAEARGGNRYSKGAALKILEHAYEGVPFKGGKSK